MKKIIGFFLLFSLLFILSCQENKATNTALTPEQLEGEWNLIYVLHGFSSFVKEYPRATIVWRFNTANQTVTIQNNSTDNTERYIFENGTYPYSLELNTDVTLGCPQILSVQDVNLGCCTITNGELSLSSIALDGDFVKLVR
ncbi:MAG: hypothetical protein FGM16_02425 [Flavobacterium sp.]|nr:hypothetical protein [Flavobacterium sp.]